MPQMASEARKREAMERTLAEANEPSIVERYLKHCGLSARSDVLRGHAGLWHHTTETRLPAIVAPVLGPDGRLQSLHRVYVSAETGGKTAIEPCMTLPAIESLTGAAVRLFKVGDARELAIAESIEAALAVREIMNMPVWAVLSASGIESFVPPGNIKRLVVFASNSRNYTSQAAAFALAKRLCRERTIKIDVEIAPEPGSDWLDVFAQTSGAATLVK